jgi:hypothetical protein
MNPAATSALFPEHNFGTLFPEHNFGTKQPNPIKEDH